MASVVAMRHWHPGRSIHHLNTSAWPSTHICGRKALHGDLAGLLLLCRCPRESPRGKTQQVQLGLEVGDIGVRLGTVYGLRGVCVLVCYNVLL